MTFCVIYQIPNFLLKVGKSTTSVENKAEVSYPVVGANSTRIKIRFQLQFRKVTEVKEKRKLYLSYYSKIYFTPLSLQNI